MMQMDKINKLVQKIDPQVIIQYLKQTGWKQYDYPKKDVAVYQYDDRDFYQVNIPLKKEFRDYQSVMYQNIQEIANKEGKGFEEILLYLLNPDVDILRLRFKNENIENGTILLSDIINIVTSIKKLLTESAKNATQHSLMKQDETIHKFVNNCRMGQTEIGSYIISVEIPLEEHKYFSERKVLAKLMDNFSYVVRNIDENNDFTDWKQKISPAFYDALSRLKLEQGDTELTIEAMLSPMIRNDKTNIKRKVSISAIHYKSVQKIVELDKKLRREKEKYETYFELPAVNIADIADDNKYINSVRIIGSDKYRRKTVRDLIQKKTMEAVMKNRDGNKNINILMPLGKRDIQENIGVKDWIQKYRGSDFCKSLWD